MTFSFANICKLIPETHLKTIIKNAVNTDRKSFNQFFLKIPGTSKYFKGFHKFSSIPSHLLCNQIFADSYISNQIASKILHVWFENNQPIAQETTDHLIRLGYNPSKPQFGEECLEINLLKTEHLIYDDDNKVYLNYPYGTNDQKVWVDITIMAVILGYSPVLNTYENYENPKPKVKLQKQKTHESIFVPRSHSTPTVISLPEIEFGQNMNPKTIPIQKPESDNEIITIVENHKVSQMLTEIPNAFDSTINDLNEINLQSHIDNANQLLIQYKSLNSRYRGFNSELTSHLDLLSEINISNTLTQFHDIITTFESTRENILKSIDHSFYFVRELDIIFSRDFTPKKTNLRISDDLTELIKQLTSDLVAYSDLLQSKIDSTDNLLNQFPEEMKMDFKETLNKIKNYPDVFNIINIKVNYDEVYNLFNSVQSEISKYTLSKALDEFFKDNCKRSMKFIADYIIKISEPFDLFCFLFLFSDKSYNLTPEYQNLVISSISKLITEKQIDILSLFQLNEDFIHKIGEDEKGKLFLLQLSIMYHFNKNNDMAQAIIYDINYDNNSQYPCLNKIVELILENKQFRIDYKSVNHIDATKKKLKERFLKENNKYVNLPNRELKYANAENKIIYPELEKHFNLLLKKNNESVLKTIEILRNPNYAIELYSLAKKQFSLPVNKSIERSIETRTKEVIQELLTYAQYLDTNSNDLEIEIIDYEEYVSDINKLILLDNSFQIFKSYFSKNIQLAKTTDPFYSMYKFINNSKFIIKFCPDLIYSLQEKELDISDLRKIYIENINDNVDLSETKKQLLSFKAYTAYKNICDSTESINIDKLIEKDSADLKEQEDYLFGLNEILSPKYYDSKEVLRFYKCFNEITIIKDTINKKKYLKEETIVRELKELGSSASSLQQKIYNEDLGFPSSTQETIHKALQIINHIAYAKQVSKISLGKELFNEVETLLQFKESSLDAINKLIENAENYQPESVSQYGYERMSNSQIFQLIEQKNYTSLGLTKSQWEDISSDRLEYISQLLPSWEYLSDKQTTHDFISSNHTNKEILEQLKTVHDCLCKICSLVKNLDINTKHGNLVFPEWQKEEIIPFFFYTKLIYPKCGVLEKQIRIFVLTNLHLKSRKYINDIKSFIQEKDDNCFNLFLLMGDREEYNKICSINIIKDIPILDFDYLKKIIFSTKENKLPKWQFASLLILNQQIESIQPFKHKGSINSDNGIFVGRDSIIKEIMNNNKDYAIYGGRKIGKTSLLNELSKKFQKNSDCITIYSIFLGCSNPLSIAKEIVSNLYINNSQKPIVKSYEDFIAVVKDYYVKYPDRKVIILLDEVDEYISQLAKEESHKLIAVFRSISMSTEHNWRFIFAGFKLMYLEIHGQGSFTGPNSPWQNFFDDSIKQLSEIETPQEVIDEGLRDVLGLTYSKDVSDRIKEYSTGHPAFLQHFCQCLVKSISHRVSTSNRNIFTDDVEEVFTKKSDFIKEIIETLDSNLSPLQKIIIFSAGIEELEEFNYEQIKKIVNGFLVLHDSPSIENDNELMLELDLLKITGVTKSIDHKGIYKFSHPYYIRILKRMDKFNNEYFSNKVSEYLKEKQ